MTQITIIRNPSPSVKKFFDGLVDKKHQQIKKLEEGQECNFTIKV